MRNPFGTSLMAQGYANARPPVHARVLQRVKPHLRVPVRRALDVGCGAGLSTRPLDGFAECPIGMEPQEAMLQWTRTVAPACEFLVGRAESIPLASSSIDLITAAGSLNYVDLDRFFPEAARIMTDTGVLVVYDFSPGRRFRDNPGLEQWFASFQQRYPPPASEALRLDPEILGKLDTGFRVCAQERFEVSLALSRSFFVDYMMTETNVAAAVRNGASPDEIRSWCEGTLYPVWGGTDREVVFDAYFACMIPRRN